MQTLNRVISVMKTGLGLRFGLELLVPACEIIKDKINQFMHREDSAVLRMIIGKLKDPKCEDVAEILTFLQEYVQTS